MMLSEDQSASEISDSESSEYNVPATPKRRQKRPLPDIFVLAEACDCTGVSNRAAAFLASFMLQGAGVITENDASSVIDKNKRYRARKKRRMNSVGLNKTALHLQSLYFDGRKDQTITQKLTKWRMHERTVVEEHIALIKDHNLNTLAILQHLPVQANPYLMCLILYFVSKFHSYHDIYLREFV